MAPDTAAMAVTDESALAVNVWPMVGQAKLKVLVWEVYDSALFTPSGTWQGVAPYQLSLTYLRDIPASKLVEETDKAWQEQGRNHPKQGEWLTLLGDLWPDITEGDNLVFGLNASGDSAFWFNGIPIGSIDDPDFGPLFGGIWLDPDTPQTRAKNGADWPDARVGAEQPSVADNAGHVVQTESALKRAPSGRQSSIRSSNH